MFKNNLKLTKIEKLRITAYMKKCAENMRKAGGSKIAIVNAYYHNEANAMSKILKETRGIIQIETAHLLAKMIGFSFL